MRRVFCWRLLALLAGLLFGAPAQAHVPHDDVLAIGLSPVFERDQTVFAIVRGSLFKSSDGGYHWQRIIRGIDGQLWGGTLVISPDFDSDRTLFVCSTTRVLRSTDAGTSFVEVTKPSAERVVLIAPSPQFADDGMLLLLDGSGALFRSADGGASWENLRRVPALGALLWDGSGLFAGTNAGELQQSTDGGATWATLASLPEQVAITAILGSGNDGALFVGSASGSVHSLDDGDLSASGVLLGGGRVMSIARVARGDRNRLLATTWGQAVFVSDDGGRSWRRSHERLFTSEQANEFHRPHFTTIVTSAVGQVFLGSFCGIFRSDDEGDRWYKLEITFDLIVGLDVVPLDGGGLQVAVSSYGAGSFLTADLGQTWEVCNVGLIHPRLGPIALSPEFGRDRTVFAGTFGRVYRSTDADTRWLWSDTTVSNHTTLGVRTRIARWSLERSELLTSLIHRAGPIYESDYLPPTPITLAVSPNFGLDRTVFVGMNPNGLLRSTDGGESFRLMWGSDLKPARAVVLSPEFANDGTLFVGAGGHAWRSSDRGETWIMLDGGLHAMQPVFAISPAFARDHTVFVGGRGGLFRSRDAGESWTMLSDGGEIRGFSEIAVSPDFEHDGTILAQELTGDLLIGHVGDDGVAWAMSGLSRSGHHTVPIVRREGVHLLKFSPNFARDRTLLAASLHTLMVSSDGGETWTERPRPIRYDIGVSMEGWFFMPVYLEGVWKNTGPLPADEPEGPSTTGLASSEVGAQVSFTFVGNSVRWIGARGAGLGIASVVLDGEERADVDQYAPRAEFGVTLFEDSGLSEGPHEITIEVTGRKNERASGARIDVNAFEVTR